MRSFITRQRIVSFFLFVALVVALVFSRAITTRAQTPKNIYFYDDGDTNITDWYQKTVIPAFEKANPQYKVVFTIARGGTGMQGIVDKVKAAAQTNADPQVDLMAREPSQDDPETTSTGLWLEITADNFPDIKKANPASIASKWSIPYRGSEVVLAHDSSKIKDADVPQTFPDLLKWVKANPGQFVYCRPDKGGSGGNFVQRAIYEATGKDPTIFKNDGKTDPAIIAQYDKAWAMLKDIHSSIYDNGSYPAGNNPVLKLLANGSVSMATVWSDQGLQALSRGDLPDTIKLSQLTDMPFPGGFAWNAIPKGSTNQDGALAFAKFLLTSDIQVSVIKEIGGFPAMPWDTLPKELQTQFTSVITKTVPPFLPGPYDDAMVQGWYKNVATNIPMDTPAPK